jgi:transposase-like protein
MERRSIVLENAQREGKGVEAYLTELQAKHETPNKMAQAIGVEKSTITRWLKRCGLEIVTVRELRKVNREARC